MLVEMVTLSSLIAIAGCFVGLAGWLAGRDKRISNDAEWRGSVNAKLDMIVGIKSDVERIDHTVTVQGERLAKVESSASQAHHRIDEIVKGEKK